ncbi:MAG: OB-fold nucleic acid binding domain-containing protein [Candidatus Micrarchaeia archaeon]|jgi:replication factor A1
MKIIDLKAGASNVEVEGIITEKSEPREVITKYGKRLNVADAVLSDDSGSIAISLWEDYASSINVGDRIKVTNGYVNEFRGNPQLSPGKYGKIEILKKADNADANSQGLSNEQQS